jgi:hypothetical protein
MIKGFDHGEFPDELKDSINSKHELLRKFRTPTSHIKREAETTNDEEADAVDTSETQQVAQITIQPKTQKKINALLENEVLDFNFLIYEYIKLEFAILCVVDAEDFSLKPKTSQTFNLTLDREKFSVYYIGKPQYIKTFQKSILIFLLNLD